MKYAFEILTSVFFKHSYFADDAFRGLQVEALQGTSHDMLNHGILLKLFNGGFHLLYDTQFAGSTRSREEVLDEQVTFSFILKLNDLDFYNYTASAGEDIARTLYYFSNQAEGSAQSLHTDEYVTEKDIYPVTHFSDQYFVKPFAKLDLQLHTQLADSYSIKFKARESYWRYILMGEYLQGLNNPAIVDGTNTDLFEGPVKLPVMDKEAIAFKSREPISFSRNIRKTFQLVDHYDDDPGRYKVIIRALPGPDPSHINLIQPTGNRKDQLNYSEIFIH